MAVSRSTSVRHLSSTFDGSQIAAADYDGTVSVWDLVSRKRISEFDTPLDFGRRRLAIHPRRDVCAIASYLYHGVACYNAATAEIVWARDKLKQPQFICYSANGERLYCGGERRP
jgi:WD40 repeat protein